MANLTISVNDSDKKDFSDFCEEVGISSSSLLNMFIKTVIREGRVPFEIKADRGERPRYKTIRAMREGDRIVADGKPGYNSVEEALEELKK